MLKRQETTRIDEDVYSKGNSCQRDAGVRAGSEGTPGASGGRGEKGIKETRAEYRQYLVQKGIADLCGVLHQCSSTKHLLSNFILTSTMYLIIIARSVRRGSRG